MDTDAETEAGGVLIAFPQRELPDVEVEIMSCLNCEHCYMGVRGLYCGMFREPIVHDSVAEECSEYLPV